MSGQPPPVNRPVAHQIGLGVQPGSPRTVIAQYVIIFGAAGGLFVYSGTPALGNPPIFAISTAATDPYGNTVNQNAATDAGLPMLFYSGAAAAGDLIASIANASGTDSFTNTYLGPGIATYSGQAPGSLQSILQAGQLLLRMVGGTVTTVPLIANSGSGNGEQLLLSSGTLTTNITRLLMFATQIGTDTLAAWDPVAGYPTLETWHSLGTLAGYTVNEGRYRLTPDGELEVDVDVTPGGANAALTAFSATLPAAYRPVMNRRFPMASTRNVTAGDNWPRLIVQAAGGVQVQAPLANITTNLSCTQRVPLT